ncbi:MAG: Rnf-Nqr domain containing protein [Oscillospiraceae bacterium]|nr:Rnf-Nqr domain containing protein [Oscillospiraceae bacterium]
MNKLKSILSLALKKSEKFIAPLKRFVVENPILVSGLSLGPVIAISQSLKAGVSLSVAFSIIIIPVLVIFGFIPVKLSKSIRVILCALLSCVFFVPALWFAKTIFPEVNDKVGVFLPLMVVNPIISARSADAARGYRPLTSMLNGIETAIGFTVVMCLVSALREILGKGTIWDAPIGNMRGNISFLLPFMGFIIVGFLAAGTKKLSAILNKSKKEEAKE